mmetsp:Transcript_36221/g.36899  ORF Transcript_36221/g.36899 Transcript_36221/m.36899 type:complete len:390 (-) Transcript_36221:131-1300(-)
MKEDDEEFLKQLTETEWQKKIRVIEKAGSIEWIISEWMRTLSENTDIKTEIILLRSQLLDAQNLLTESNIRLTELKKNIESTRKPKKVKVSNKEIQTDNYEVIKDVNTERDYQDQEHDMSSMDSQSLPVTPAKRKRQWGIGPRKNKSARNAEVSLLRHKASVERNNFYPDQSALDRRRAERMYGYGDPVDDDFRDKIDLLLEYYCMHGTCNIPIKLICTFEDGSDLKLGKWMSNTRGSNNRGELRPDRKARLQELVDRGMLDWELVGSEQSSAVISDSKGWDERFQMILDYGESNNGNCNVPSSIIRTSSDGVEVKLGKWVSFQRALRKRGRLHPDREARLQALVDQGKFGWHVGTKHAKDTTLASTEEPSADENTDTPVIDTVVTLPL